MKPYSPVAHRDDEMSIELIVWFSCRIRTCFCVRVSHDDVHGVHGAVSLLIGLKSSLFRSRQIYSPHPHLAREPNRPDVDFAGRAVASPNEELEWNELAWWAVADGFGIAEIFPPGDSYDRARRDALARKPASRSLIGFILGQSARG